MTRAPTVQMVTGIGLMLGAVAVGAFGYRNLTEITTLLEAGSRADAEIVRVQTWVPKQPGQRASYTPVVRWTAASGRVVEVKSAWGTVDASVVAVGRQLEVVYDPDRPGERFYVLEPGKAPSPTVMEYVPLVIALVFFASGAAMTRAGLRVG